MDICHTDFESRGVVDLGGKQGVGLYNYMRHPQTQMLMCAYAMNNQKPQLWEIAKGEPIPKILQQALIDPSVMFAAWNSPFERYGFKYPLGIDIPYHRWLDPQVSARYMSLPDDLETAALAMSLPSDMMKDARGEDLISIFSKPQKIRMKKPKKGQIIFQDEWYWRDWNTDPKLWANFGEYCCQDVVTERELMRRFGAFEVYPLPEREHKLWLLDQKINDKGMPTDRGFVKSNGVIGLKAKDVAIEKLKIITGLENPNSDMQMLRWVRERGYEYNYLRKEYVALALDETKISDEARQALLLRKISRSTSYTKLDTIERQLCPDDRLRNQFIFLGSSRCGRWSSGASQLHNMARPIGEFEEEDVLDESRKLIYAEDYDGLAKRFGEDNVMLAVKSNIRSSFVSFKGYRLSVSDLNAIETRVAAWIANCQSLLNGFRNIPDFDPYLEFASRMTGIPYEDLLRDIHSEDKKIRAIAKRHRQIAKVGVLQCVYRAGAGNWGKNKKGDPIKTGLWGSAENMGIKMSLDQAVETVRVFREVYKEIKQFWFDSENAVFAVLKKSAPKNATASFGVNGCIKVDKICRKDKFPILRLQLPSGRYLHYVDARIEDLPAPWLQPLLNPETGLPVIGEDNKVIMIHPKKPTIVYAGVNQDTKQWEMNTTTHGGKITENVVQGIARDAEAEGMLRADAANFDIIGHAHDEILTENHDDDFDPNYRDLERLMSIPIAWAPGLPLGAAGYSGNFYHK